MAIHPKCSPFLLTAAPNTIITTKSFSGGRGNLIMKPTEAHIMAAYSPDRIKYILTIISFDFPSGPADSISHCVVPSTLFPSRKAPSLNKITIPGGYVPKQ